jgi:hypothetical protein
MSSNITLTWRRRQARSVGSLRSGSVDGALSVAIAARRSSKGTGAASMSPSPSTARWACSAAMALSTCTSSDPCLFAPALGGAPGHAFGRGWRLSHPVCDLQAGHLVEVAGVVGHQLQPLGQRVGGDLRVDLADRRAAAPVCVLQRAVAVGRLVCLRQVGQLQQKVVDQAAPPVVSSHAGLTEAQFGAGQCRDGHGLLQQALVDALLQPG